MSETQISRAIMGYLTARRIFAVRMNSGTQIGSYKGKKWAIHMNAAGTADILAFPIKRYPDGDKGTWKLPSPLWLEVKTDKGKQSELQKCFQAQVEAEGHLYGVVRSIDDVEALLK
jgi:hypothetical protein